MNIQYLIQILQNKLTILNTAKGQAFAAGNIDQMNAIDQELLDTQNTFNQLNLLQTMAQQAAAANTTTADLISSGLDAVQNPSPTVQGPSATAVINGYDISAYATDDQYEQKIQNILSAMPTFVTVGDVDTYVQKIASGSPVLGSMVAAASQQYSVEVPLMLAIMQNDSCFGTLGVGVSTLNPGNIGNTGSATKTFSSWQDGVNAVADWLNRHRVVAAAALTALVNTDTAQTPDANATSTPAVALPPDPTPLPVITPTPAATSTGATATSTPPVSIPTTPPISPTTPTPDASSATTTTATTSPIIDPIDTATSTAATSTPSSDSDSATSTATTTLPIDPTASSTPSETASSTATTTPIIDIDDSSATTTSSTTAPIVAPPDATSSPDVTATSTQAYRWSGVKRKNRT